MKRYYFSKNLKNLNLIFFLLMSKLTKKQDFEWFQDQTSLKINYPIKGISIKKIDIYFAPYFIKLNVSERNQVKYFDLMYEIDYTSKENTILYINDVLEIRVIKKDPVKWEELNDSSLSKEQIMKRRQDSIQRKEEYDHKFKKNLDDLKIKHDRHSVSEQMRLEQNEREWLESKKKEEKEHAEEELYADLDENKQFVKKENEIFDGNEINDIKEIKEEEEIKEIPEIRGQKAVQLKFTEKVYPNLATRETHMKEAPFPKIKHVTDNKDSKKVVNKISL